MSFSTKENGIVFQSINIETPFTFLEDWSDEAKIYVKTSKDTYALWTGMNGTIVELGENKKISKAKMVKPLKMHIKLF